MSGRHDPRGEFDVLAARALAFEASGWIAGSPVSDGCSHRATLAGALVDGQACYMTDLTVARGVANAHTRIPMLISPSRKAEAVRLCAALNACFPGGTVWVGGDGEPGVTVCVALVGPESAAAAGIVHAVRRSRTLARLADPYFDDVRVGKPAGEALSPETGTTAFLDALSAPSSGSRFEFDTAPAPSDEQLAAAVDLFGGEQERLAEAEALARVQALSNSQAGEGLAHCVGPVIIHADGVVECFGCEQPLDRIHGGGMTGACCPVSRFGIGHRCERCEGDES